jgi:hypothetical protein
LFLPDVPSFLSSGRASESLNAIDHAGSRFFDIQTLRSRHVGRARYTPGVHVRGSFDHDGQTVEFDAPLAVHVLAHTSGFVCLRPTLRFDQLRPGVDTRLLRHLEGGLWDPRMGLRFQITDVAEPLIGNMRTLLNRVFLDLLTRWAGEEAHAGQLADWAQEGRFGCERLHQLTAEGRLDYPYPVSFGMQTEVCVKSFLNRRRAEHAADRIAHEIMRGPSPELDVVPVDIDRDCRNVWWYVEENQALTLTTPRDIDPELDVIDTDRTQLLEFLAIRRAALRSVQRETQRILVSGRKISRGRVDAWHQIVATTTDDYVLDDRIGRLMGPLRHHNSDDRRLRDLAELEAQVRANLHSFQRRLDASGAWVSSLLGALVSAGALVIGLDSVIRSALARLTGVPVAKLPAQHPALLSVVTIMLLALTFAGTYALIRRASVILRTRFQVRRSILRRSGRSLRATI